MLRHSYFFALFLAFVATFSSGCLAAAALPGFISVVAPAAAGAAGVHELTRKDCSRFEKAKATIERGSTKDQVLEVLGKPLQEVGESWTYTCEQEPSLFSMTKDQFVHGERAHWVAFLVFRDGVVSEVTIQKTITRNRS